MKDSFDSISLCQQHVSCWRSATVNGHGTHDTSTVWNISVPVAVQEAVNQLATTQARLPACLCLQVTDGFLLDPDVRMQEDSDILIYFDGLMVDDGRRW